MSLYTELQRAVYSQQAAVCTCEGSKEWCRADFQAEKKTTKNQSTLNLKLFLGTSSFHFLTLANHGLCSFPWDRTVACIPSPLLLSRLVSYQGPTPLSCFTLAGFAWGLIDSYFY